MLNYTLSMNKRYEPPYLFRLLHHKKWLTEYVKITKKLTGSATTIFSDCINAMDIELTYQCTKKAFQKNAPTHS